MILSLPFRGVSEAAGIHPLTPDSPRITQAGTDLLTHATISHDARLGADIHVQHTR
ncbi:hypothetical protein ACFVXW_34300 [Streptomyces sp. NPDC058251]|uniref:hypothetical protein n=1 Tax=unclassified Streptomyces TaxID=2593676 RepID=UPI003659F5DC